MPGGWLISASWIEKCWIQKYFTDLETCLSDPVGKPADDVDCDYGEDKLCNLPVLGQCMAILGGAGLFQFGTDWNLVVQGQYGAFTPV